MKKKSTKNLSQKKFLEKFNKKANESLLKIVKNSKKLNKKNDKRLEFYRNEANLKKNKDFSILQKWIERKAKGKNFDYVPLKNYISKIHKINLRSKNPNRQKNLDLIKTLKNTVYFPTIPSMRTNVESDQSYEDLKDWEYFAIELNPEKMLAGYLSTWFNEEIPKLQLTGARSGSYIPHMTKNDLEKIKVINHSIGQQKKIITNFLTASELQLKAIKLKQANVFEATEITIDEIVKDIPDLELKNLINQEESFTHEYKSSLRYSTKSQEINDHLVTPALRTIVAFLNSGGGHLLIGIEETQPEENNIILGIEIDRFKSQDEWHRFLKDKIKTRIGIQFFEHYIKVEFKSVDKKTIAIIKCAALEKNEHSILDGEKILERKGPSNRVLPTKEIGNWVLKRIDRI